MPSAPSTYKAAVIHEANGKFKIEEKKIPELKRGQVLMKVEANGVCHSDSFTVGGAWPGLQLPKVPGHEIVGNIIAVGEGVPERYAVGKRFGRGWFGGCCFACEDCRRGDFITCEKHMVSGIADDGGYAEYAVAPWESLSAIPDNLSSIDAAPLMCAGVTVFNSLRNTGALPPATVAIIGLGGLGHLAVQFASKMGYRTVAISSSDKKRDFAHKLGAHEYIDGSKGKISEQLQKLGGARVVLSTMDNVELMSDAVNGLGTDGVIVTLGATMEQMHAAPAAIIGARKRIQGWPSGTSKDSEDTLLFASLFGVKPITEEYPLEKAQEAFDTMMSGKAHFRGVLVPHKH